MRKRNFRIDGRFDAAPGATVTVDPNAGTFSVRPLRRRRSYTLPLRDVAEMVFSRIVVGEFKARRKAKKDKRK